jgi:hypothetical protein
MAGYRQTSIAAFICLKPQRKAAISGVISCLPHKFLICKPMRFNYYNSFLCLPAKPVFFSVSQMPGFGCGAEIPA